MSQEDILKILDIQIKAIDLILNLNLDNELKYQMLWKNASSTKDIAMMLGISIHSVSSSISKLILQKKIIALKNRKDNLKKIRYIKKDGSINNLVNDGSNNSSDL